MNPETLALYTDEKMQDLFWDRLSRPEIGDRLFNPKNDTIEYIVDTYEKCYICTDRYDHVPLDNYLLLPYPISRDESKPERGLWGMISKVFCLDGNNYYLSLINSAFARHVLVGWLNPYSGQWYKDFVFSGTPTLALLKAIKFHIEQEEKS